MANANSLSTTSAGTEDFAALLDATLGADTGFAGSVVTGKVIRVDDDVAVVDVGLKSEGRVPLKEFAAPGRTYRLGHCFSFPFRQLSRNSGLLLEWTKEIKTRGVVGQDVNYLLSQALQRRGLEYIQPAAILNDTVATLLCAAYLDNDADIGSICGTGYNACFGDLSGRIINIEAGNFLADILPVNRYDLELDRRSHNQGQQRLEKMVSGAYLGELFRLMLVDLHLRPDLFSSQEFMSGRFAAPHSLDSRLISDMLSGGDLMFAPERANPDQTVQRRLLSLAQALAAR